MLHSTVGYIGIPDGGDPRGTQSLWAWSSGASSAPDPTSNPDHLTPMLTYV